MRLASFNPRRLGRVALVIAANLCLLATLIVITEGLLRWSALVPPMLAHGAPDAALWQYDSVLGWMTVPGVRTVRPVTGPDAGVIRLNEYGFRGRALTPSRQADAPRVLVFGDSFVFGVGIDEQHLFPAVLERLLRDRRSRGHRGEDVGPWRALKKRLVADGIACFGLHERLAAARAAAPEQPWDFGRDAHWNVASHEKAAEIVYDILLKERMLEDSERRAASGGRSGSLAAR